MGNFVETEKGYFTQWPTQELAELANEAIDINECVANTHPDVAARPYLLTEKVLDHLSEARISILYGGNSPELIAARKKDAEHYLREAWRSIGGHRICYRKA